MQRTSKFSNRLMLALCLGQGRALGRNISKALVPSDAVRQLFEDFFFFLNRNLNLFYPLVVLCNIVASHIT